MKSIADSSVLIALLNSDDDYSKEAAEMLGKAMEKGGVFINPVIYAEIATQMKSREKVEDFLEDTGIKVEQVEKQSSFKASQKFSEYLANRGDKLQCPNCGQKNKISCQECEKTLSYRQHIAPDFLIGAHAENQADQILTLDKDFFRSYYPGLKVNAI